MFLSSFCESHPDVVFGKKLVVAGNFFHGGRETVKWYNVATFHTQILHFILKYTDNHHDNTDGKTT